MDFQVTGVSEEGRWGKEEELGCSVPTEIGRECD